MLRLFSTLRQDVKMDPEDQTLIEQDHKSMSKFIFFIFNFKDRNRDKMVFKST